MSASDVAVAGNAPPSTTSCVLRCPRTAVAAGENRHVATGAGLSARKLEEDTESTVHATVDRNLSQAIQQARLAKKLTQKELATAIMEKATVIQEYESGRAIPNPTILSKLDRALGVHLPRPPKKK